jgi:hypothetical protein
VSRDGRCEIRQAASAAEPTGDTAEDVVLAEAGIESSDDEDLDEVATA